MKARLILVFLFFAQWAYSTHLAGGEIMYKYISKAPNEDVTYEVTMNLYMDCYNGSPAAIAGDSIALLNVFDGKTGALLVNLCKEFGRQGPFHFSGSSYKCLKNQPNACIDMYVYKTNIVLPKRANGYILSFERCCRNIIIINILDAPSTGSTYWTEIKAESDIGKNSSPVFKLKPSIFLCTNAPFSFDHSASDEEGDSLAYELSTPYLGGSATNSRPDYNGSVDDQPVFPLKGNRTVFWAATYSLKNEMDGNPILEIDGRSGKITVTPVKEGLFVIGVKVKEFRKGVLIGETKRDFQFWVANCSFDLLSLFYTSKTNNVDSTISFTNQSIGATSYQWDFGDPSTGSDVSQVKSPTYSYSKPGTYKITLVVKNSTCTDTSEFDIVIKKTTTTGISSFSGSHGFVIYPNPNNGCFNIESGSIKKEKTIEIFDQIGQEVYRETFIENPHKLNLNLCRGIYLIKVTTSDNVFIQRLSVGK